MEMSMEENSNANVSVSESQAYKDIKEILSALWTKRKVFYWVLPITFVVSCALILSVPKYYSCEVILAPEVQSGGSAGSLQALASSFGVDMTAMTNADAIYPMIYPDVVESPNFLVTLFDIHVETADNNYQGTYYDYLLNEHKQFFLSRWKNKIKSLIQFTKETEPIIAKNSTGVNVFCLSKKQWHVIGLMRKCITCSVDKRTNVITFNVTAQDKTVCATIGDSVSAAMQSFVTDYRTKKTRADITYYEEVSKTAYQEYREASERYIQYVDGHSGIKQEKYRIVAHNLETEMLIKQAAYTSFQKQYLAAQARLQENTPVFTVLQSGAIPLRAAGPKKTIFVLAMLILVSGITFCIVCRKELLNIFIIKDGQ